MLKADAQSRLYCAHYVPSNTDCPDCRLIETDYTNRPLYAPLYVPLSNLPTVLDNSQLKLPNTFYIPFNEKMNNSKRSQDLTNSLLSNDCFEMKTKQGIVRMPRSTLIHRSSLDGSTTHSNHFSTGNSACNPQQMFPGDFQKHAHRYTRSFSWKTKPEEPPFAQMQPLPKLVKRPGYVEMCCKNVCWPTHQLCLCCGRNTAESCRKWSKSTGEYDYIDACWSSCALCSDDAYKIFNTPVVYNEKIIDPELLLPLDAELLYYSIQSAKRQQERQQKSTSPSIFAQQLLPPQMTENQQDDSVPFASNQKEDTKESPSPLQKQESNVQSELLNVSSQEQQSVTPSTEIKNTTDKSKQPRKSKSSKAVKAKKSSRSVRNKRKKPSKNSRSPSKRKSSRSRSRSKRRSKSKK